jgi:hypothetical protein
VAYKDGHIIHEDSDIIDQSPPGFIHYTDTWILEFNIRFT